MEDLDWKKLYISEKERADRLRDKNIKLVAENNTLKEQLKMFIPRRRVRLIYKITGKILNADIDPIELEKQLKENNIE